MGVFALLFFALLFVVSFLVLISTLAVMYIRKCIKTKDNVAKGSKHIGWVSDMLGRGTESTELRDDGKVDVGRRKTYGFTREKATRISLNTQKAYVRSNDLESSMMKREVSEAQERWKETVPKHKTRIKLRNSRKLRNKRKEKK